MIYKKGLCLKCGSKILEGRKTLHNYSCQGYKLDNGNVILIGMCKNCRLDSNDFNEAFKLIADKEKYKFKASIVGFDKIYGQGNIPSNEDKVCNKCGKLIKGNYVYNMGYYIHEICNEARNKKPSIKLVEAKVDKTKAKRKSKKNEKELSS